MLYMDQVKLIYEKMRLLNLIKPLSRHVELSLSVLAI